jgi:hypothetical protein
VHAAPGAPAGMTVSTILGRIRAIGMRRRKDAIHQTRTRGADNAFAALNRVSMGDGEAVVKVQKERKEKEDSTEALPEFRL